MKQELVSDWMTRDVITIAPETSLKEAHDIMNSKKHSQASCGDCTARCSALLRWGIFAGRNHRRRRR